MRREQPYAVISSSAQRDDGRTEEYRIVIGGSGSEAAGVHPGRFGQLDGVDFGRRPTSRAIFTRWFLPRPT